jgi:hypothetical protein
MQMQQVLNTLYERAKGNMTAEELESLGGKLTDDATTLARHMAKISEGIGCLVVEDAHHPSGAGSFQDADSVFRLLWALSVQFDTIAGMVEVGSEATFKARQLKEATTSTSA